MSGHSKWASIKHKKAQVDARRGKLFSKLTREIMVAARQGGGNPETNPRLRIAISAAKSANMPGENIQKAIMRGTGELPGVTYEEVQYEGYGPAGVAIIVDAMTDNKNRTTAEIRHIFNRYGGNLSGAGSVNWQFQRKGFISVDKDVIDEETLFNIAIENGAEDFKSEDDSFEITTDPGALEKVKEALAEKNINTTLAEITLLPTSTIKVTDEETARKILTLVEALEEHDDVQHVYSNFDIPDEIIKQAAEN